MSAPSAEIREPRCTWRCRNRARALASVTLEGDECVRVPIIASYVCVRAPIAELRVHRHDELDKLGVAQASHRPCGLMEMSVRVPIAELCTHRHVESGELGVVTSAFSTTLRDARAHRGRRVLRSLPHAKMHTARPDRYVEWAIA